MAEMQQSGCVPPAGSSAGIENVPHPPHDVSALCPSLCLCVSLTSSLCACLADGLKKNLSLPWPLVLPSLAGLCVPTVLNLPALVSVPLPILVGCSHSPVTPPLCPPISGSLSGTAPESGLRVCPSGPFILEPQPLRGPWHLTSSWVWDGLSALPRLHVDPRGN